MAKAAKATSRKSVSAGELRSRRGESLVLLKALVILAAAWWIYAPVFQGAWLWDDDLYITDNPLLRDGVGLWKIWFAPGSFIEYYPVEATALWLQWHLWGAAPLGYHLVTWVGHVSSALLVWRLLAKLGLRHAWLGGLLFAIHPAQVESVAWVAEMKNTISLPPFLLAMSAWIDYEECRRPRDYAWALVFFLVAMLAKISMAPFPVVILLYAWWKRGRIGWNDLKASAPFFFNSLALGLLTVLAGIWYRELNLQPPDVVALGGFWSRVALVGLSLSFYFTHGLWPMDLSPIYPMWKVNSPSLSQFWPWPIFGLVFWWLWRKRATWGRHVLLGLGFFLLNLAPFLGLKAVSYMSFTWVMDHFLYLPIIGLIGLAVAGLDGLETRIFLMARIGGSILLAVALILMAWRSRSYAACFVNPETLWTYTIKENPDAWPAYANLGKARLDAGDASGAKDLFAQTLALNPSSVEGRDNYGNALLQLGRPTEAIAQYEEALRHYPTYAGARNNLGSALLKTGQVPEAIEQITQAVQIKPTDAQMRYNLGVALAAAGKLDEAIQQYEQALVFKPDYPEAHNNLGLALMRLNRLAEAMPQFEEALRLKPDFAEARNNQGLVLMQTGHLPEAMAQFEQAWGLKPDFAEAHSNMGNALNLAGRLPEAVTQYQEALRLRPDFAEAHNNLGSTLQRMGRMAEALAQYQEAVRLNPNYADARNNLARLQAQPKAGSSKK